MRGNSETSLNNDDQWTNGLSAHGSSNNAVFLGGTDNDVDYDDNSQIDVRKQLFEAIPEPYPHPIDFQRVIITETVDLIDQDSISSCKSLKTCMNLRDKWLSAHPFPPQDLVEVSNSSIDLTNKHFDNDTMLFRRRLPPDYNIFDSPIPEFKSNEYKYEMVNGVMVIHRSDDSQLNVFPVQSFDEFVKDFNIVREAVYAGPTISYSFKRLELLLAKFNLHIVLNANRELEIQKSVPHRDFYNIRKVDTHVHHSACMNQKHLLRFIKHKLKNTPNEIVVFRDGRFLTLGEVFKSLHITAYDLSIDTLDMHANNTFRRFDRFNLKYNPAGQSRLREIFLKTDNVIGGKFLAEITREVINDLEAGKYQLVEWRVSIYGRKASEWESLAKWFYSHRLAHQNVRWLIQIPRLYNIYRQGGEIRSFSQMMYNIFAPLIAVTLDPLSDPPLHYFLMTVVGLDSVDDESRPEQGHLSYGTSGETKLPLPDDWTLPDNPPYGYWMYYMYSNLAVLNQLRASRGMNTFQLRPHCGEAGDIDHLISSYLLAHQINHGIQLRKNASLQYLYYLSQIGIAMSPLSNNKLFLDYNKNPFPKYFYQGLNVSLSTDDPLMLHYTKDPLVEEYSVATQVWKLSSTDQCEIARNSVIQSGWERRYKVYYLGKDYNDIKETNVPDIRLIYRKETLDTEIRAINSISTNQ
eukprot:gene19479-25361_t